MKLKNLISSSAGIGMVQAMIIATVVAGAGLVVMKTGQQQNKISQTATQRVIQTNFRDQVAEALQDGGACVNTLKAAGVLANQKVLPSLRHRDDAVIYAPLQKIEGMQEIKDMKLVGYQSAPGLRYHKAPVNILINTIPSREGASAKSFGGQQKGHLIPLFLITRDNQVEICSSDDSVAMLSALRDACLGFGGFFNEDTATCEKIHGKDGIVLQRIEQKFCSTGNPTCPHPYAGQVCTGSDVRGASHPNWVYGAFDGSGEKVCHCLPKNCANPALYCINTDLGTNWCDKVCPVGIKDEWTNWTPTKDTVCLGVTFTQTQICSDPLGNLQRGREEIGTKTGGAGNCSYDTFTLNPDGTETSAAQMVRVNEEYECSSYCSSPNQRNCSYVSDCAAAPSCTDTTWSPEPATVCLGTAFTQTSNCSRSRGSVGTKNDGACSKCDNTKWTPEDLTLICNDVEVSQTNGCGETRKIKGTKDCSKKVGCKISHPIGWSDADGHPGHCNEYFRAASSTTPIEVTEWEEGEVRYLNAGYVFANGYNGGSGSAVAKCVNGGLQVTQRVCRAGKMLD